jgi:hypothetical protein
LWGKGKVTKVVITGSRDWPIDKAHLIWDALRKLENAHEDDWFWSPMELHHGECPFGGADLIAASWAAGADWGVIPHPPEQQIGWAYAKRNKEMIDLMPDYVVVCYLEGAGNRGTTMTHEMALAQGLDDRIIVVRG